MSVTDPFGLVGQVLDGQFRIDKLVGEGGFSAVYRGHHQGLGEPIAVKCLKLPSSLPASLVDTFIQRFRDESRILYRLSQGNLHIVRSIAAGTTQTSAGVLVPYMVLEWLEGRSVQNDFTVRRTLGQTGRALDVVLKLFETAADGLAYAHSQGVAHRDLNPGNLFLAQTQQGLKMKVLDFGVAKLMHDGALDMGPRAHTVGQIKIFAPAYGAPEQFDDRIGKVSTSSDVYSFALILIEALRDKSINEGTHIGEFAQAACDPARRPTPRFYGADVPEEVEAAFARATRLDPKERWQTVGDFWQSLTIANKVAVERRYETAARETPPLAMGNNPPPGAAAPQAPSPANKATAKSTIALTMPLGSQQPGFPRPGGANAPRPRTPTTIGIPAPAGGLQRPPTAPLAQNPAATAKTMAFSAFAATDPGPPPPSNRSSSLPTQVAAPPPMSSNSVIELPSQDPLPDEEEDDATKVHAPAPEMLRTLAFNQGNAQMQQARAQADAMIAAQRAAAAQASAAPPQQPPPPLQVQPAPSNPPYVNPNEDIEEPPDSGGTLMMAPAARQKAMSSTIAMQAPPPPSPVGASTMAMASPFGTPGYPPASARTPEALLATRAMDVAPIVAAPGMQGIPGARGTPPQGMPAMRAPFPSQPHAPPLQQQAPPAYAQAQPQMQPQYAPPQQQQPSLAAAPPVKPLPIIPIVAVLAVLALGGLVLGGLALRSRHSGAGENGAGSASASGAAAALTPVPVETTPPATATATAPVAEEAADAAPATVDLDDAAVATTAPATTATPPAATTALAANPSPNPSPPVGVPPPSPPVGVAPPPAPKPTADPNAFSESGARGKLGTASGVLAFCKHEGGVTGPGSANVTFAPDGSVSSVGVDPPYAGTKEGDCVASQFRRVKISPFIGSPATVKFPFEVPK